MKTCTVEIVRNVFYFNCAVECLGKMLNKNVLVPLICHMGNNYIPFYRISNWSSCYISVNMYSVHSTGIIVFHEGKIHSLGKYYTKLEH